MSPKRLNKQNEEKPWVTDAIMCYVLITLMMLIITFVWCVWGLVRGPVNNKTLINETLALTEKETLTALGLNVTNHRRSRVKRMEQSPSHPATQNPCKNTDGLRVDEPFFCYNTPIIDSTVLIPMNTINLGRFKGDKWLGYPFYMRATRLSSDWGWVFATTEDWSSDSYGWQPEAKEWAHRLKFKIQNVKEVPTLILQINSTLLPLAESPKPDPFWNKQPCYVLALCVVKTGEDPCSILSICSNITEEKTQSNSLPKLTLGPKVTKKISARIVNSKLTPDDWFIVATGISGNYNNWLLMAEQAAAPLQHDCLVCLGPRPILKVVPAAVPSDCILDIMTNDNPGKECMEWDKVHPLSEHTASKPLFDKNVATLNWTCVLFTGPNQIVDSIPAKLCAENITTTPQFKTRPRADVWWWCGSDKIYDKLPKQTKGTCALVSLLLPARVVPMTAGELWERFQTVVPDKWRSKRAVKMPWNSDNDPTYIDAIGVPRGVPDEYKLVDQIATGFENIPILAAVFPVTPNKNVDRINYIHYNVQKLGNYTEAGFSAIHEQLAATSLMAFQNRIALDMLLAEKGSVCALFNEQCCTFIPNNTATGGKLTMALEGLRTMNKRMKDQSGVRTSVWDGWMSAFGQWRGLMSSALIAMAVFTSMLTVCGCCCIPCIRALILRLINTAIAPDSKDAQGQMPLLADSYNDLEVDLIATLDEATV